MPPTAEHEALHRVFHRDEALFARAVARVFNVQVPAPEPGGVTVLSTDLTETQPLGETPSAEIWKAMMATRTYPFVSQTRLQGREEGRAEGLAAAIFKVFDRRGIKVDDDSRQQIESCTDSDQLEAWLDRSFVVAKASDLFV